MDHPVEQAYDRKYLLVPYILQDVFVKFLKQRTSTVSLIT